MSILNNTIQNNVLQAAEQKIESQLTPANRADYLKIVTAGMKIALQGGPKSILAALSNSKTPLQDCVHGAINLCGLMWKQSRGTMPIKAMVPAAMTLLIQALDFADKSGIVKIGAPELVQATHMFTDVLFAKLGISKAMLHTAAGKVHGLIQDPAQLAKLNLAAGVTKDPRAPQPTLQPEGDNVPS